MMQDEQKREEYLKEQRRLEEERRQKEVLEQVKTLKGKFGSLVSNLKDNRSDFDMTIAGIKLLDVQIRALVSTVGKNNTLKCLSLNRKNINDEDG
mmetsp:Transcript_24772/g.21976  ORF Transcript_24772/g.21976 Transcript_24772/m.21976 type:complete len:95 (-) Transcript_24772:726-1010(-)